MVSVSTTATSSGVVVLLGSILLGCFLLGLCLPSDRKPFAGSSEERRRRCRHRFLLGGVTLEVKDLLHFWWFGLLGVGRFEAWLENKLEA
jgi:hypothetical protein